MTTAGPERPLTAADLLFGSSADASQALTREIMSASRGQNLGSALKHLPRVTREAAAREATVAAAGLMKIDLIDVLAGILYAVIAYLAITRAPGWFRRIVDRAADQDGAADRDDGAWSRGAARCAVTAPQGRRRSSTSTT